MTVTVADIDAARAQTLTEAVCQATVKKINNIMDGNGPSLRTGQIFLRNRNIRFFMR